MALSDAKVRNAKPKAKPYKIADGEGLFLMVAPSGSKYWRLKYAWAERAKTVGYPERFAQEALGHNSKAVQRAYAKRALMKIPSLQEYEERAGTRPVATA